MATPLDGPAAVATILAFGLQSVTLPLVFKSKYKKNRALLDESRQILDFCNDELYKYRSMIESKQRRGLSTEYDK